jgi:hypothetical protein
VDRTGSGCSVGGIVLRTRLRTGLLDQLLAALRNVLHRPQITFDGADEAIILPAVTWNESFAGLTGHGRRPADGGAGEGSHFRRDIGKRRGDAQLVGLAKRINDSVASSAIHRSEHRTLTGVDALALGDEQRGYTTDPTAHETPARSQRTSLNATLPRVVGGASPICCAVDGVAGDRIGEERASDRIAYELRSGTQATSEAHRRGNTARHFTQHVR